MMLKDSIRKDGLSIYNNSLPRDPEDGFLLDLDNIITEELKHLIQLINMLENMLTELGIRTL
jgi:hypothetical protein